MSTSKRVKQIVAENNTRGQQPKSKPALTDLSVELMLEQRWLEAGVWGTPKPTVQAIEAAQELDALANGHDPLAELGTADIAIIRFLSPTLDQQINEIGGSLTGMSIMEELRDDYWYWRVPPHREGTPIGAYELRPCPAAAPMLLSPEQLVTRKRKEMLDLRAQNDRALARLLSR